MDPRSLKKQTAQLLKSNINKNQKAIRCIELTHRYDTHLAVDNVSFSIEKGTTFGLIGPNGAGKSTTIKMLTTLLPPTSGNAYINQYSIIDDPEKVRQNIGYVPQLVSADGELTGFENLLITAKLYGIPKSTRYSKIDEILKFMDLNEYKDKKVSGYSGGMIRRLEIAQSLIHEPSVLFLDEPTIGLDPAARKMIWKYIKGMNKKLGTTILMTTHDMEEADTLSDIVALMHVGKIVVMDTPENLKKMINWIAALQVEHLL